MDITNKKFGSLTVISFSHKEEKQCPNSIARKYYWNCICECGNKVKKDQSQLIISRVKNCGDILTHGNWNREQEETLKLLYPTGSWDEILTAIPGKNKHAIGNYAINRGIKRELDFGDTIRKGTLKPLLEETNVAYYWIGFIIADGWINHKTGQLVVMTSDKDVDHLHKFAALTKSEVKFPYGINGKINSGYHTDSSTVRVAIQDPAAFGIIKKFHFVNRKTSNPPRIDFNSLTDDLFLSLVCGYIDGDGAISMLKRSRNNINIKIMCHSSYISFLKKIELRLYAMLKYPLKKSHVHKNTRGYASFVISNNTVIRMIKQKLTSLSIPAMERKWNRIT